MRFGLKVGVVAVEPIDTAMRFEVCLVQNTPDTRAAHSPGAALKQGGDQVVQTPAGGSAVIRDGFMSGHRHHIQALGGGKAPRATRARGILKATETLCQIATSPTANGMAITVELLSDLKIQRSARCRSPQDQLTTKGQGLGC